MESLEEKGIFPQALENKPEIFSYVFEYVEAFYHLSARRTIGFSSENPISMSDIAAYLSLNPTDDPARFVYMIGEMDSEYLTVKYSNKGSSEGNKNG